MCISPVSVFRWNLTNRETLRIQGYGDYVIQSTGALLDYCMSFHNLRSRNFCGWRDSLPSTLSLLVMSLRTWPLQSCARSGCLETLVWRCVYKIYGLFRWRTSDFRLRCGRFLPRKFMVILRIFELVSYRKQSPFVVRPISIGKGVAGVAL